MPTYEFKCLNPQCEEFFEIFQKMSDPVPICPKCGNKEVAQILTAGHKIKINEPWRRAKERIR